MVMEQEDATFEGDVDLFIKVDENGTRSVKGGSIEKLVDMLTYYKHPSSDFTAAFLMTYRSFTTGAELLGLLIRRYDGVQCPECLNEVQQQLYKRRKITATRLRFVHAHLK
jgi:son of sevenless-like protein